MFNRQCCLIVLADWKICNYVDVTCNLKHRITHTSRNMNKGFFAWADIGLKVLQVNITIFYECFKRWTTDEVSSINEQCSLMMFKLKNQLCQCLPSVMWNTEFDVLTKHEPRGFSFGLTFGWRCFRSIASSSMDALRGRQQNEVTPKWAQSAMQVNCFGGQKDLELCQCDFLSSETHTRNLHEQELICLG